ncbi:fluoride efflux transporter FluC [Cellulomonas sp. Marseille-Q8402]
MVVAVALMGGLGAVTRYLVDGMLRARSRTAVPLGTMVVNLSGAFALGVITGLVAHGAAAALATVAGTGFLGGYTTFSTTSLETARLLEDRRWLAAFVNAAGMLVAAVALAAAGFALGHAL